MKTKPRTVHAVLLTFEENNKVNQQLMLYSLKGNASSLRRAFTGAAKRGKSARMIGDTLEKLQVVPVLSDDGFFLATHAVAATWEGENGVAQLIELFETAEEADARKSELERAFANGSAAGRLIALTCEKTQITAPISEGDAPFRSYMDAVDRLKGD